MHLALPAILVCFLCFGLRLPADEAALLLPGGRVDLVKTDQFVKIEGGKYEIGNALVDPKGNYYHPEEKQRFVEIQDFWIAKLPITAEQFCLFLNSPFCAGKNQRQLCNFDGFPQSAVPRNLSTVRRNNGKFEPWEGNSQAPANSVSWLGAAEYCRWLMTLDDKNIYRLPSEAEWEVAARGKTGRSWPWGDAPPTKNHGAIFDLALNQEKRGLIKVGSYPQNATPDGILDLCGTGIANWCAGVFMKDASTEQVCSVEMNIADLDSLRPIRGIPHRNNAKGLVLTPFITKGQFRAPPWTRSFGHPIKDIDEWAGLGFRLVVVPKQVAGTGKE